MGSHEIVNNISENAFLDHTFWANSHFGLYIFRAFMFVLENRKLLPFWSLLSSY